MAQVGRPYVPSDTHPWPSAGPSSCWGTSSFPAPWTKPCRSSSQRAAGTLSPSLARPRGDRGGQRASPLSCWRTRCRRGASLLPPCSSARSASPQRQRGGRVPRSPWCSVAELGEKLSHWVGNTNIYFYSLFVNNNNNNKLDFLHTAHLKHWQWTNYSFTLQSHLWW